MNHLRSSPECRARTVSLPMNVHPSLFPSIFCHPSSSLLSLSSASLSFLPPERTDENKQALARYYVLSQLIDRHMFLMALMQYYSYDLPACYSDSVRCAVDRRACPCRAQPLLGGVESLAMCFITLTQVDRLKAMHRILRLL